MSELRFDGRVAIVTGAGRGIGRAYAELLAARGASVVVNDLGGSVEGQGSDLQPAEEAVAAITAAGGSAVADGSDVSSEAGAGTLIELALDRFGRLDVLVNNAGIMRWASLPDADADNLAAHLAVHVGGTFNTVRAAWPHFTEQGYGRVVNTVSAGMFGLPANLGYATAKGAVLGMTRSLATAGRKVGIRVNAIAPAAATRMGGEPDPAMAPELVAPMAAYLAHEECPVTGEVYTAGAGRFGRLFLASTPGYVSSDSPTMEELEEHWDVVGSDDGYTRPRDLMAWSREFLAHREDPA